MENASKALIIAGAILISILLIQDIWIFSFSTSNGVYFIKLSILFTYIDSWYKLKSEFTIVFTDVSTFEEVLM